MEGGGEKVTVTRDIRKSCMLAIWDFFLLFPTKQSSCCCFRTEVCCILGSRTHSFIFTPSLAHLQHSLLTFTVSEMQSDKLISIPPALSLPTTETALGFLPFQYDILVHIYSFCFSFYYYDIHINIYHI